VSATSSVQGRFQCDLLGIEDATRRFFGSNVSPFSVRRWIAKGVGHPPVKLRAVRLAGRWFLRPSDINEFIDAVADPELYRRRQTTERCERAKQRLKQEGA
jgi:hypothetical protein